MYSLTSPEDPRSSQGNVLLLQSHGQRRFSSPAAASQPRMLPCHQRTTRKPPSGCVVIIIRGPGSCLVFKTPRLCCLTNVSGVWLKIKCSLLTSTAHRTSKTRELDTCCAAGVLLHQGPFIILLKSRALAMLLYNKITNACFFLGSALQKMSTIHFSAL